MTQQAAAQMAFPFALKRLFMNPRLASVRQDLAYFTAF
jgi:hypothetical protein